MLSPTVLVPSGVPSDSEPMQSPEPSAEPLPEMTLLEVFTVPTATMPPPRPPHAAGHASLPLMVAFTRDVMLLAPEAPIPPAVTSGPLDVAQVAQAMLPEIVLFVMLMEPGAKLKIPPTPGLPDDDAHDPVVEGSETQATLSLTVSPPRMSVPRFQIPPPAPNIVVQAAPQAVLWVMVVFVIRAVAFA